MTLDEIRNLDLGDLTLENIGLWPLAVKVIVVAIIFFMTLVLGIWFDTQSQLQSLDALRAQELTLRQEFELKEGQAANLGEYKKQLASMQRLFSTMVKQLPNSTEVPGLLEEISKTGVLNGLQFALFKPLPEKQYDFFSELPIQITVLGSYHQLAEFVSQIAAFDRIVVIENFDIHRYKSTTAPAAGTSDTNITDEGLLEMNLTAVTFRYAENNVTSANADTAASV